MLTYTYVTYPNKIEEDSAQLHPSAILLFIRVKKDIIAKLMLNAKIAYSSPIHPILLLGFQLKTTCDDASSFANLNCISQ